MKRKAMKLLTLKLCNTKFIWRLHRWCNNQIKSYRRPTWIGRKWEKFIGFKIYPFVRHIYCANDCPEIVN
jgi:hypothetical protein